MSYSRVNIMYKSADYGDSSHSECDDEEQHVRMLNNVGIMQVRGNRPNVVIRFNAGIMKVEGNQGRAKMSEGNQGRVQVSEGNERHVNVSAGDRGRVQVPHMLVGTQRRVQVSLGSQGRVQIQSECARCGCVRVDGSGPVKSDSNKGGCSCAINAQAIHINGRTTHNGGNVICIDDYGIYINENSNDINFPDVNCFIGPEP